MQNGHHYKAWQKEHRPAFLFRSGHYYGECMFDGLNTLLEVKRRWYRDASQVFMSRPTGSVPDYVLLVGSLN